MQLIKTEKSLINTNSITSIEAIGHHPAGVPTQHRVRISYGYCEYYETPFMSEKQASLIVDKLYIWLLCGEADCSDQWSFGDDGKYISFRLDMELNRL